MSEIDKLINRAFPDELRNVEPAEVDEDAILALTLQKLGLKETETTGSEAGKAERTPRPARRPPVEQGGDLEEAPLIVVRHSWVNWAGWIAAACLVIVFAINWGPWLIRNLGFGTGQPYKAGDKWPTGPNGADVVSQSADGDPQPITVTPVNAAEEGEDTFSITLDISSQDSTQVNLDWFDFRLTTLDGESVEQVSRSNGDGKVLLVYSSIAQEQEYFELAVRQLVPLTSSDGSQVGFDWQDVEVLVMNLEFGTAASQLSEKSSVVFDGFAVNRRQNGDDGGRV